MKAPKPVLIHLLVGRESTFCGRGESTPAFTTRDREKVTCPRCQRSQEATCPAQRAYRDRSDIGSDLTCGRPAVTPAGFCHFHDPATKPARDARGRIIAKGASSAPKEG